jgi:glutamate dehydrogenase
MIWLGGIGTFVKATDETQGDAGDRANDALRINGNELRCKVVGEGANLGFTQKGRVEYALKGGRINTDAIDNSAAWIPDHEVNIKILLGKAIETRPCPRKRDALLVP